MKNDRIYNYLELYIDDLQAGGKLAVSLKELREHFNSASEAAIKLALNRLFKKGRIVSVYKGFYVIVPLEYRSRKILPPELFIDMLFKYLERPYYLGLLSSSAMHGASHQQAMESYAVINKPPLRSTFTQGVKINYMVRARMPQTGIEKKKTETGYINVAGPELTALDLIEFNNRIGGLNRASTVLYELSEEMSIDKLNEVLEHNFSNSVLQRLGYILDCVLHREDLSSAIKNRLTHKKIFRVPLRPDLKKEGFYLHPVWKIIENYKIETDFS